jgi:heavy metal translocating P-type ATPase
MRKRLGKFFGLLGFFRTYKQFGFVLLSILIALPLDFTGFHTAAHIILIISATLNVIPLLWGMVQDLREGTYGVDILAATAIITSVLLHEYWAGMIIILMLTGGESLEDYAERRAKTELTALLERTPTKAHLLRGRKVLEVKVSTLRTGDKLIVKPGEVIPVDSVIQEGTASFDESSLTGESLPVEHKPGEELLSGSVNLDGAITIKALRSAEDSQYQQIVKLVRSASASKAPFVRLSDRFSIPFTIAAFAIAIAAWVISGHSIRFLEVLVVATPCPLILSAPIALISGMSRAAKQGIIVKTGSAMERMANLRTMAFDKTGTLTLGTPEVDSVTAYASFTKDAVLGLAAALEQNSNHVLARAVVTRAKADKVKSPKAKQVQEVAGKGLAAHVQGKHVLVGRFSLIEDHDIILPKSFRSSEVQQTAAYVAVDGKLAGVITFKDEIRPEAKDTIADLRRMGIGDIMMVTGDSKTTALAVAKKLGISDVRYEALPADKIEAIESANHGPVGFVGDGVNDAPVLAASDLGIALGARGSTAASESADVVILVDNIEQVASGIRIAKRTFFIAKQSILLGIGMSVVLMLIFSTGHFKPLYGAIVQELVDVAVIFNALRAHSSGRRATSAS